MPTTPQISRPGTGSRTPSRHQGHHSHPPRPSRPSRPPSSAATSINISRTSSSGASAASGGSQHGSDCNRRTNITVTSPAMPRLDSSSSRLVVVSNRLPVTITSHSRETDLAVAAPHASATAGGDEAQYTFKMSSGGLVSAVSGCKRQVAFTWIGWSGLNVAASDKAIVERRLAEEYSCKPVWLSDDIADRHYNGFSNSILWPLFHYHPGEMSFDEDNWKAYQEANRSFAEAVWEEIRESLETGEDVLIWVQDYHLMLLPSMLRQLIQDSSTPTAKGPRDKPRGRACIGFFLHTPFPSSEIYRILPVRNQILLGILDCDLIGFHTYDYARHFLSSCTRILGLQTLPNGLEFGEHYVHVGSFPIGIDPKQFQDTLQKPSVRQRIETLQQRFDGIKVIVGVDRLDYIKGVPQKLHALDVFLSEHPEWIGKVVLVQVAVPSRQDVEEYQNLRNSVNELVGRINGRYGTVEHMPIHFLHRSISFDELCALYAISDACLVTSTRDGMNLVSYEYVACQQERHGCLILSEFTGAAHSLNGSLIVNPWATDQVADAINRAVTMSDKDRAANFAKLSSFVSSFTAAHWGLSFVAELQSICGEEY